ncbi:helix-turn-helix transcriptional regulator [uncultured Bacteroides sp.]|uniref:helix-turn-helix domain-containing protein n=1 Tax=uncultured Bacteroides sp. TaxID=162156 RepID=UPI0026147D1D|nr:helix-turn-helix transcriptional regulator [uncultured Bacteroides sp.]
MYDPQRILDLIAKKRYKLVEVYTGIGMSRQAFSALTSGKSKPSFDNLEKMADFFQVPIDYFFGRDASNYVNSGTQVNGNVVGGDLVVNEINHLKELLAEKDVLLAEKERTIQILMKNV